MNACYEAARLYLASGLHPIPIAPMGKHPLVGWKEYQDRAPAEQELFSWWSAWPDANVGLVFGRGTVAVDCDSPAATELVHPHIPAGAPWVKTSKGTHFYLRGTAPDRVNAMPGVDVRGVGYVVAPPSIHISGVEYEVLCPITAPATWPELPASLRALIEKPAAVPAPATGSSWVTEALAGVGVVGRNATMARLLGYLWGKGLPEEVCRILMAQWRERLPAGDHPFTDTEYEATFASIVGRDGGPTGPPSSLASMIDQTLSEISAPPKQSRPAKSQLATLDDLLSGGLHAGELLYLGARPGMGKTALALQWTRAAAKAKQGVLFVSLEMTKVQLTRRLLVQESGIPMRDVKMGKLESIQIAGLVEAGQRLRSLPVWITSDIRGTTEMLEAVKSFESGDLGLVVIDYLQLMRGPDGMRDRRQSIDVISRELKELAVRAELPVICLSSLSRPPKDISQHWRPVLSDLKESGNLEHDADIVCLLWRDGTNCELRVAKNRDGDEGVINLQFDGSRLTFEEPK